MSKTLQEAKLPSLKDKVEAGVVKAKKDDGEPSKSVGVKRTKAKK